MAKPVIKADGLHLEVQTGPFPIAIFHFAFYMYISAHLLNEKSFSVVNSF